MSRFASLNIISMLQYSYHNLAYLLDQLNKLRTLNVVFFHHTYTICLTFVFHRPSSLMSTNCTYNYRCVNYFFVTSPTILYNTHHSNPTHAWPTCLPRPITLARLHNIYHILSTLVDRYVEHRIISGIIFSSTINISA